MSSVQHDVTSQDTAEALGTGDVPVLATPRLIGWMESATMAAAASGLEPGKTTVGTSVRVEHTRATPVGRSVTIDCSKPVSDGHRLIFQVTATDSSGEKVATGEIQRAVVTRDRFLHRARR